MTDVHISVDVEASGPRIGLHSMLQLGACLVGDVERNFNQLLLPISGAFDEQAMKIIGKPLSFFEEHGSDPIQVMRDFGSWVRSIATNVVPVFVGFNAAFDWGFVNWYFLKYGDSPNPFGYAPLDIKAYYAGLTGCSWEETRSSMIPERFKPRARHTHDALDDATEQAEMFRLMLESR
jgi:DNA polymerase III epsilon subunit-like protein